MKAEEPINTMYPKVKPLALALVAAAAEQGATAEEFEMACRKVRAMITRRAAAIRISEFQDAAIDPGAPLFLDEETFFREKALQRGETEGSVLVSLELRDAKTKEVIRSKVSEEEAEHLRWHLGF